MTEKEEDEINMAFNYASSYEAEDSHVNPEGYSERQIGMLHGFMDGYSRAKNHLYTKDDLLVVFKAGNTFLNNNSLNFQEAFEEAILSLNKK